MPKPQREKIEPMILDLVRVLVELEPDIKKFDRGNQRIAIKIRKKMQDIKLMIKDIRFTIQDIKHKRRAINQQKYKNDILKRKNQKGE